MIDITNINPEIDPEIAKIRESVEKDYEAGNMPNSYRALLEAKQDNLDVVFPEANQLQLDIDNNHAFAIYQELLPIVEKYYGVVTVKVTPSRSGGEKRHVTLTLLAPLNPFERIALQACLGSDRVREILGVVQAMNGDPHPTLFLERKPDAGQTIPDGSGAIDIN